MIKTTGATQLQPAQLGTASEVMGRAFADDPLLQFFMPDDAMRNRYIAWFMGMSVDYGLRWGLVHSTPEQVKGAAVWLRPGETVITPWRMVQVGAVKALWRLGPANLKRMLSSVDHFEKICQRVMTEPFWYLMSLGVDPVEQGQGVGGQLITPVLAEADKTGQPCYLETQKERNLPFYERQGFEVVATGTLPLGGPEYWTMRRPPAK
jgi:GNAT superfamily N-acetyltransferase